ncbi:thiol peroxidase [Erysipelothrix urinaevulpis]|uniref:thiol peroxidase n=1 Tax=Erysipelothrix urinaevulpis TaxID=2683717 RepID=UPI00135CE21A|nr:thiol peroxidase [Erysipelothrix urinaevulpis]
MQIARKGVPTTIDGIQLTVGDKIKPFNLVNREGTKVSEKDFEGKNLLISVYPDINTSVCDRQTRQFFELASSVENCEILNVSNNSLDALNEWCATSGLDVQMLSAQDTTFQEGFGLWMPEFEVLARSIFVVNKDGIITYSEIVPDMAQDPDYEQAIKAANSL